MKKFIFLIGMVACLFISCSANDIAEMNQAREARTARLQSEYATSINKLEMKEGNFETLRRITFYNVRLGEIVFACEGYAHVEIDNDGDVEIVVKVGDGQYLRHYLGQKEDITYFSEQLKSVEVIDYNRYQIVWNPKKWIPQFDYDLH